MNRTTLLTLSLLAVAACDLVEGHSCTDIGCMDGLILNMTADEPGEWVFTLTLDGDVVTCLGQLPFPDDLAGLGCDDDRVSMTISGTELPDDQQSLGEIYIDDAPAEVIFKAELDGTVVFEETFAPEYRESAPNGEECGPICYSGAENVGAL